MKKFVIIAAKGCVLLLILCGLLLIASRWIINSSISHALRKNGISDIVLQADKITPWTTVLQSTLGSRDNPAVSLPRIEIKYSPGSLAQGRIDSATIDGAVISAVIEDGKIGLKNFNARTGNDNSASGPLPPILPIGIDSLRLNNCRLVLYGRDFPPLNIIVSGQLSFHYENVQKKTFEIDRVTADFQTDGTYRSRLHASLDINENPILIAQAELFDLADFLPAVRSQVRNLSGKANLAAEVSLSRDLQSVKRIKTSLELPDNLVDAGTFQLVSRRSSPLLFTAEGGETELDYQLSNVHIESGVTADTSLKGKIFPAEKKMTGKGQITSSLFQIPIDADFEASRQDQQNKLLIRLFGGKQQMHDTNFQLTAGPYAIETRLTLSPAGVTAANKLQINSVKLPEHDLLLADVTGDFLYRTNTGDSLQPGSGNVIINEIRFKGENLARFAGTVTQNSEKDTTFDATLDTSLANPVKLSLKGSYSPENKLDLNLHLPQTRIDNFSLPPFINLPEGLDFSGNLQADGLLTHDGRNPAGHLELKFSNGNLRIEEKDFSLSGISTGIVLPHLPQLLSSPSQVLAIEEIRLGSIHLNKGRITYRLEKDNSLFIEKSRFNWCQGRIEGGSLRIKQDSQEFTTTFYCDRLQFSELLSQFSITGTEGDGSLNGRLPVSFSEKGLAFDDGFLFSTPGNSGIVRFANSDMLRDSMPDMGQAAYLDYSLQALDDFSYNWTKLTFNSQGDDLVISMQIDGKPATPLPFGYKNGQLVSSPKGGGIQHPIRLDVNFHLPLAEMFKYGQNIQSIMENM